MIWQEIQQRAESLEEEDLQTALRHLNPDVQFADRPMPSGLVFVPREVKIVGDTLVWNAKDPRFKRTRSGMLNDFIALCDDADNYGSVESAIAGFALKWGVLGLCEHGLPCSHNQYPYGLNERVRPCLPRLVDGPPDRAEFQFWESLDQWVEWSRRARAIVRIGAQLNLGRRAKREDWLIAKGLADPSGGLFLDDAAANLKDLNAERKELAEELDGWISLGQVRPRIEWRRPWRFSLAAGSAGPNLFGVLALFMITEIANASIAICSSCCHAYRPERRIDPKRRNYCPACRGPTGRRAAVRDAQRDWRGRQRAQGGRGRSDRP